MQFDPQLCRVDDGLDTIVGKWKLPILLQLIKHGTLRFSDLKRTLPGITQKMLTQNLKELEEDDLVIRVAYPTVPPKVEYSLTEHGQALQPIIDQLHRWGIQHRQHIQQKWADKAMR